MDAGFHLGEVVFPLAYFIDVFVKRVGVGIEQNAGGVAVYHAFDELLQILIVLHEWQVGPHLCGTVAQPHGIYIAGDDVGIGAATHHFEIDRGVEGVGETVAKEPGGFGVFDVGLQGFDERFYGGAAEAALGQGHAYGGETGGLRPGGAAGQQGEAGKAGLL